MPNKIVKLPESGIFLGEVKLGEEQLNFKYSLIGRNGKREVNEEERALLNDYFVLGESSVNSKRGPLPMFPIRAGMIGSDKMARGATFYRTPTSLYFLASREFDVYQLSEAKEIAETMMKNKYSGIYGLLVYGHNIEENNYVDFLGVEPVKKGSIKHVRKTNALFEKARNDKLLESFGDGLPFYQFLKLGRPPNYAHYVFVVKEGEVKTFKNSPSIVGEPLSDYLF